MRLLVATKNAGKVREIRAMLSALDPVIVTGLDAFSDAPDVDEDGETFEANALKKARAYAAYTGLPTIADDSGLVVDALGGAPGVHSARYAGQHGEDDANNRRLLDELSGVEARTARFVCAGRLRRSPPRHRTRRPGRARRSHHRRASRRRRLRLRPALRPDLTDAHHRRDERQREERDQPPRGRDEKDHKVLRAGLARRGDRMLTGSR